MNSTEILNAVSFPVKMMDAGFKDPFGNWVNIPDRKAVVRMDTGEALAIHSDQYKLIPYVKMVDPLLRQLEDNGGALTVRQGARGKRALPLSVEAGGRRIWIESNFNDYAIQIGKDRILPRLTYGNSYDGTASYRGIMGFFQVSCTNIGALIKPGALKGFGSMNINRRHIGGEDVEFDDLGKHIKSFLSNFGNMAESLQGMLNSRVETDKAREIMTEYAGSRFVDKHYHDDAQSAWELYAKVTNYLTFDYKGGVALSERRAALALAEIQREMR